MATSASVRSAAGVQSTVAHAKDAPAVTLAVALSDDVGEPRWSVKPVLPLLVFVAMRAR